MLVRSNLHDYQNEAVEFAKKHPKSALWLGLGLGKSCCALTTISDLMDDFHVKKTLVVAPLRVAKKVWSDEVKKWEHTHHLRVSTVVGTQRQRVAALKTDADIYVINVENLIWLENIIGRGKFRWDMLVLDEASMFKNRDTKRFKVARRFSMLASRIIELTATPSSNGYQNLWSQFYLLDGGQRLGLTVTAFRQRYFVAVDRDGYKLAPKKGAEAAIQHLIRDITLSMKTRDHLHTMPPLLPPTDVRIDLSPKDAEAYKKFERDAVLEVADGEIEAVNAMALATKLAQFSNGHIYDEEKNVHVVHDAKIQALSELVDEAGDDPVVIAYAYKSDRDRLLAAFPDATVLGKDLSVIDRWQRGEISKLLVHPASAAHGIDGLQHAGNIIIWYGLTWSLELYEQLVGRLDRQGQTRAVRTYRLICNGTVDEDFIASLNHKSSNQQALLDAMRKRVAGSLAAH